MLATAANIGSYYRSPFAVVPEGNLNLSFQLNPRITIRVGYSFLFINNVLRPGNQISRVASPTLVPTDPAYGTGGPIQPTNQFHSSTYW